MHEIVWKKICCPVDFSDPSKHAARTAAELAKRFDADLTLLHVETPGERWSDALAEEFKQEALKQGAPRVEMARDSGDPGQKIPEYAGKHGCSLIVMGTHGRTGRTASLVGSVAEGVVRNAACPVLTVK